MLLLACLPCVAALPALAAQAQPKPAPAASAAAVKPRAGAEPGGGPAWRDLRPSEQAALKPLQGEWASIDELGKRKWLRIAERYPAMNADDQVRLQARMTEWARLTPQERGKVRLQFLEATKMPASSRQANWEAYQALSPDERKALAARGAKSQRNAIKAPQAAAEGDAAKRNPPRNAGAPSAAAAAPSVKPARPATPSVVQGAPGATTNLITKQQAPAPHPAAASAKIAVSPDVVDKSTLLPRTGPQSPRDRPTTAAATAATRP